MKMIQSKRKGAMLMLTAAVFYAITAAMVKSIQAIPVAEKVFFRNLISLLPIIIMNRSKGVNLLGNNKKFLVLRAVLGLFGAGCYFYALSNAPLADTVALANLYPFFVIIFSFVFIKEDIQKVHIFAFIVSIMGAILIIKPQFDAVNIFYILAFASAVFTGGAYTTVKHLQETEDSIVIMFYFSLITAIVCIPFVLMGNFVLPKGMSLLKLLLLGGAATFYQFFMTSAYKYAPAGEIAIYSYASIVVSAIIGILVWHEIPNLSSVIGIILIISAAFFNYRIPSNHKEE